MNEKQFEQAQAYTERLTQAGIERATGRCVEQPLEIDGQRHCLDCDERLEPARLSANPQAVRCVDCQRLHERRGS